MKVLCMLIFVSGIILSCSKDDDPAPLEILTNGSMDAGSVRPNSWWHNGNGYYHTAWTDEDFSSPKYALKIYSTTADTNTRHYAFWAQTFQGATPIGKDVTFSVKVKGSNLEGDGITLSIYGHDTVVPSSSSYIVQSVSSTETQAISGTFDWTTYRVTLKGIQSGVKSITVYLIMNPLTTGTVYFDDASLHPN